VPAVPIDQQDSTYWAKAIGAARSGDLAAAQADVKLLAKCVEAREARARKEGYKVSGEKAADLREAQAWLGYRQGKAEEALKELRAAVDRQEGNGGEAVIIPAREKLADMLADMKRTSEALAEYETVLRLGAGRAAQAVGDSDVPGRGGSPGVDRSKDRFGEEVVAVGPRGRITAPKCRVWKTRRTKSASE